MENTTSIPSSAYMLYPAPEQPGVHYRTLSSCLCHSFNGSRVLYPGEASTLPRRPDPTPVICTHLATIGLYRNTIHTYVTCIELRLRGQPSRARGHRWFQLSYYMRPHVRRARIRAADGATEHGVRVPSAGIAVTHRIVRTLFKFDSSSCCIRSGTDDLFSTAHDPLPQRDLHRPRRTPRVLSICRAPMPFVCVIVIPHIELLVVSLILNFHCTQTLTQAHEKNVD